MAPWARVTQSVAMGRDVANTARTERSRACRTGTPCSERRERGPEISLFPSADCASGSERVTSNDQSFDDSSPTSHRTTFLDPFFAHHAREETRAASNRDVPLTSAGHCRRTYMYEGRRVFSADYLHSHARRSSTRVRHHNLLRISRR